MATMRLLVIVIVGLDQEYKLDIKNYVSVSSLVELERCRIIQLAGKTHA